MVQLFEERSVDAMTKLVSEFLRRNNAKALSTSISVNNGWITLSVTYEQVDNSDDDC